ncbi:MAG: NAD(P)/FAD-dependent oxidoreductase [Pseudomonadales bacterium]
MSSGAKLHYDVIVLGAGAAGLFCAFTAAKRGRTVLVLEKANKIGKKILMSGGGRCNFTNHFVEADNYISNNVHFCKSALMQFTQWDFIALVEQYNIDYEERKHSQIFCKNSARDILNMLRSECELAGVTVKTHSDVQRVESVSSTPQLGQDQSERGRQYKLSFNEERAALYCHSLVIATGALSVPTLGGSDFGYKLAEQFKLPLTERRAGLVPFMFSAMMKPICERLSGLALEVEISCRGQHFTENLLFTHRGISGPSVLQISNYWHPGDEIVIDLLPGTDATEWLLRAKKQQGKSLLKTVLGQRFSKSLVRELQGLWWADHEQTVLAEFSDQRLTDVANHINAWHLKPSATEGYRTAEVTLGGVDTNSISSKTMEAKQQPGLFFIGEVLDVSGHLGGFNFQWAWSSGYVAGVNV